MTDAKRAHLAWAMTWQCDSAMMVSVASALSVGHVMSLTVDYCGEGSHASTPLLA